MSTDISNKILAPGDLYQILREKVFQQKSSPDLQGSLHWRERIQLPPGIAIAQALEWNDSILVVLPTEQEIQRIYEDLQALGLSALVFPDWGTSLYKGIRTQNRIFTERSSVLAQIIGRQSGSLIVLTTLRAMARVLPPPAEFQRDIMPLEIGIPLQPAELASLLSSYGYYRVPRVTLPGEFALRGEVVDFYPPPSKITHYLDEASVMLSQAVRVMFGFDEIEMLKVFDTSSQISHGSIEQFSLFPLKEVVWQPEQVQRLRELLAENVGNAESASEDWQEQLDKLALQQDIYAEELLFPLVWEEPVDLRQYLGSDSLVMLWDYERLEHLQESYALERKSLYQEQKDGAQKVKLLHMLLELSEHLSVDLATLRRPLSIVISEFEGEPWPLEIEGGLQYFGNIKRLSDDLKQWLADGYFIALGASSEAQAQRIAHILQDFAANLHFFDKQLSGGVMFPEQKLILLQEWQVLGREPGSAKGTRASKKKEQYIEKRLTQSEIISSFVELKEGDLVVHIQHGVGRFKRIERIRTSRMERDYLALEYADDNVLFVPIEQINMVQRYIGGDDSSHVRLDRIGGRAWQERKAKTQKAVEDLADSLLRLYARRAEIEGYSYPSDDELQEEFEADFSYEPTRDQLRAAAEIKEDLESPKPMDRLLCGDVGFGKTEVAMRACFKVANSGRQVMLLCPTTILAEQHYQNFGQRFARFPVRIAMLSRFVEDQNKVLRDLESGTVDILIGTHRILSKDIQLKNLGLIVIDEEQRFGVKHKERLKMLKTSVDCLSMSATPIPRTLHMSLVQIRDISMLTTPPRNRHPVETFVREFNPESIATAIRHELLRGGQVFYLHNRVQGLEETVEFLRELVPEAMVEMAHGQMDSKVLEDIMYRFVHGGFNVLLATTIIENGIDIPNVNTIIIDRADRYGIGQLYQLRGRVGRSDQLAYAYLFYPDRSGLSDLALKRLKIISDFTELGSGFKVAMKDLEVRGAGNLLGPEQSGSILSVGFEMYSSMLAKAMRERKPLEEEFCEEISLELDYSGFIPNSYIPDATEKIDLYKRIAQIDQSDLLTEFYEELYDRFGNPPDEVNSLLSLAEVRILCREVGINYLKERQGQIELKFSKLRPLPLDKIMRQIQQAPKIFRIEAKQSDVLLIDLTALEELKIDGEPKSESKAENNTLLRKTLSLRQLLSTFKEE